MANPMSSETELKIKLELSEGSMEAVQKLISALEDFSLEWQTTTESTCWEDCCESD